MNGDETFRRLQSLARSTADRSKAAAPTQEYLTRHALESFLDRLTKTSHAKDFVLKGGLLLGAYGVRRPTKDADSNAISADVTAQHLMEVIHDVANLKSSDGVSFLLDTVLVVEIRDEAEYPGYRVRVKVRIGNWTGTVAWDVSTGDPIVPAPRRITLDRILGDPITMIGYSPESTVAEKGVTILERGLASTRWRDYVDIVTLGRSGLNKHDLSAACNAVANFRGIQLRPITPILRGYEKIGQAKWAAWRRKEKLESICEERLDDQIVLVAAILDPIFELGTPPNSESSDDS